MSVKSENVSDYEGKAGQVHNGQIPDNDIQTFHAIVIFAVFKEIMAKKVTKKYFVFTCNFI